MGEIEAKPRRKLARSHRDLEVYAKAYSASMAIFELTKTFPKEELYSLTDQVRRSTRSVCANIAEAWRKRRYPAAFVSMLSDAEAEAAESQVWIEYCVSCRYLTRQAAAPFCREYNEIISMLVAMIMSADQWTGPIASHQRR